MEPAAEGGHVTSGAPTCSWFSLFHIFAWTPWLRACATAGSDPRITTVCPPVVEYTRDFQARAADELNLLPEGSAIAEMLADYSVVRDQARACSRR